MIGCIFAENGPLESDIESSFRCTGWGAKGDFRWIFDPNPCIFEGGPPPFSEGTRPHTVKNNVSHKRVAVLSVKKRFTAYLVIKHYLRSF